jgi:hypothetical protein
MGKQFKLDPRNKSQQGFRIKLLANKLQTLDQYKQYRKFNHINMLSRDRNSQVPTHHISL